MTEPVELATTADAPALPLRRIELVLDRPTADGDTVILLLTTLPATVEAGNVARLYRGRWSIEGLFGRLEAALNTEVRTLGRPRAALLAFGIAVVAYNVLSVIQAAIAAAHDLEASGLEVSTFYVADDVRTDYRGMTIAISATTWATFDAQPPARFAKTLCAIAAHLDPRTVRKHPRVPEPKRKLGDAPSAQVHRHVSAAKLLRDGRIR